MYERRNLRLQQVVKMQGNIESCNKGFTTPSVWAEVKFLPISNLPNNILREVVEFRAEQNKLTRPKTEVTEQL